MNLNNLWDGVGILKNLDSTTLLERQKCQEKFTVNLGYALFLPTFLDKEPFRFLSTGISVFEPAKVINRNLVHKVANSSPELLRLAPLTSVSYIGISADLFS